MIPLVAAMLAVLCSVVSSGTGIQVAVVIFAGVLLVLRGIAGVLLVAMVLFARVLITAIVVTWCLSIGCWESGGLSTSDEESRGPNFIELHIEGGGCCVFVVVVKKKLRCNEMLCVDEKRNWDESWSLSIFSEITIFG